MNYLARIYVIHNTNFLITMMTGRVSFCVLIVAYIALGYEADAELIFYILSLFAQLNYQFGMLMPVYFMKIVELFATMERLNKMLQKGELQKIVREPYGKPTVSLQNVSIRLGDKTVLNGVSVNSFEPGLTIVTGPVGSGKSSLLKTILQEYNPISEGKFINKLNNVCKIKKHSLILVVCKYISSVCSQLEFP